MGGRVVLPSWRVRNGGKGGAAVLEGEAWGEG